MDFTLSGSILVDGINIGQKSDLSPCSKFLVFRMRPQRFVDELNRKIAASNANHYQICQFFASGACPGTRANFLRELVNVFEDWMNIGKYGLEFWPTRIMKFRI